MEPFWATNAEINAEWKVVVEISRSSCFAFSLLFVSPTDNLAS